jgi:hypothetical protein
MQGCIFCGGDASAPDHHLHCDGRQGHIEAAHGWRSGTTRSTTEAMTLLEETRKDVLETARVVALRLIRTDGATHTRAVFGAMRDAGQLPATIAHHYWLGALFRVPIFQWTGGWYVYSDRDQNIHERRIKTWTTK